MRSQSLLYEVKGNAATVLKFESNEMLHASIHHYLTTVGNPRLLSHRLMEILLLLERIRMYFERFRPMVAVVSWTS